MKVHTQSIYARTAAPLMCIFSSSLVRHISKCWTTNGLTSSLKNWRLKRRIEWLHRALLKLYFDRSLSLFSLSAECRILANMSSWAGQHIWLSGNDVWYSWNIECNFTWNSRTFFCCHPSFGTLLWSSTGHIYTQLFAAKMEFYIIVCASEKEKGFNFRRLLCSVTTTMTRSFW